MTDKVAGRGAGSAPVMWVGGAITGFVLAGLLWYFGLPGPEEVPAEPAAVVSTGDGTSEEAAPEGTAASSVPSGGDATEPGTAGAEEQAAVTAPEPPAFDTVRAEADGSVLVAGRAGPGAEIAILVDGAEVATATADSGGAFAAFLSLPTSDAPRVLTLAVAGDGGTMTSEETVIIAPTATTEVASGTPAAGSSETVEAAADDVATSAAEAEEPGTGATADQAGVGDAPSGATPTGADAEAPDVLIVDSEGVRKQVPGGLVAAIVIDTIGYGPSGEVEIAGRGKPGAFARLYLDNRELATVPVGDEGQWSVAMAGLDAGLYTLRVDEVDTAGKVTSRFETPFQREEPEAVASALATRARQAEAGEAMELASATGAVTQTDAPRAAEAPEAGTAPAVGGESGGGGATRPAALAATGADAPPVPVARVTIVTVQPGFTLWRIARENYGEGILYVKVFEANKDQIRDPDLIYPGQIFSVPEPTE